MQTRYALYICGIVVLILTAAACTLGGESPPTATPSPTFMLPPSPTFVLDTATPFLSPTPTATPVTPTLIPCVPLASWTIFYSVQPGDTVFDIALATGATVEQIVIANCLQNANAIFAGQLLRVPMLPVAPTSIPTATLMPTSNLMSPRSGTLTAVPHWIHPRTGQAVTYHPTVRMDLGEVYDAFQVDFYVNTVGGPALLIGSDFDPWDGAFIDYRFPSFESASYTFVAFIINDRARLQSNVFTILYDPAFVPPEGRANVLAIAPHRAFDGTNYTLAAGSTVTIQWTRAPLNALYIDFYTRPYTAAQDQMPRLIGSDRDLSDGGWIAWQVPAGLYGYIFARATLPDGSTVDSQIMSVISE